MEQITLDATNRELLGKKAKLLRSKNEIPAVVYGRGFSNLNITLDYAIFNKVSDKASESTLIDLRVKDQAPIKVLIRDIQRDPILENVIHVDFYKVDMKEELQTEIPLTFEGSAPAVEDLEGNFISLKDAIKVECLPDKLVSEIKVDISALKTFEDLIHVKDLDVPEGIKVLDDSEEVVAQVTAPTSEEELAAMEEEAAASTEKTQIENIEAEAQAQAEEKAEAANEEPAQDANEQKE